MALITNQAALTYQGVTVHSNITTGRLMQALTAEKTAVDGTYTLGDEISFAISLMNAGTAELENLTVTDDLGAFQLESETLYPLAYQTGTLRYFINGVLQPAPALASEAPLTVGGITVPAGGCAMLLYEAVVTELADRQAGACITNTAVITGTGISDPVSAQETIFAQEAPELSITKAMNPTLVQAGGQVCYTLTVLNTGNQPVAAADGAVVSDTFNPVLKNLNVTLDGETVQRGVQYSYDEQSGLFATLPGAIAVDAATFAQDPATGAWNVTPGAVSIVVTGTL
ncbi:MAG: DUF11 domain-containing protein [Oscillospiraceae bacterium]|nr:DUF11 domain-containing protein [Oscillospiraceae bacterium]